MVEVFLLGIAGGLAVVLAVVGWLAGGMLRDVWRELTRRG